MKNSKCSICLDFIKHDVPFAIINHPQETQKYHPSCLKKWFSVSNMAIITRKKVESYDVFIKNDHIIKFYIDNIKKKN